MLTHIDKKGNAKIVDITKKEMSKRFASATGKIYVSRLVLKQIKKNSNKKGDILTVAKIAGIMGAKKTSELVPLCHPLMLEDVTIDFTINEEESYILVLSNVKCYGKTGVEIEAITSASICLITIYDMCKAIDTKMVIKDIMLLKKVGGKKTVNNKL